MARKQTTSVRYNGRKRRVRRVPKTFGSGYRYYWVDTDTLIEDLVLLALFADFSFTDEGYDDYDYDITDDYQGSEFDSLNSEDSWADTSVNENEDTWDSSSKSTWDSDTSDYGSSSSDYGSSSSSDFGSSSSDFGSSSSDFGGGGFD